MDVATLNVSTMTGEAEQMVDAAALAASSIAKASGLDSLEAIAMMLTQIGTRLDALEADKPGLQALQQTVNEISAAVQAVPSDFVERVEGFFGKHFPQHAAPVNTDATKTE